MHRGATATAMAAGAGERLTLPGEASNADGEADAGEGDRGAVRVLDFE